ncbi:MAG: beta-ketoacyl-[acyl-carrier-protein] synthase family protein [Thermoleophilaceae bacterium]
MRRRVVVTGVGAITPLGVGARTLHEGWVAGRSGIADGVGRCADFDPAASLSVKEARRTDRCTQLALVAAGEALTDAGWDAEPPYPRERIGSVVGTGIGGIGTLVHYQDVLREQGPERVSPLAVPLMMANAPSASVAMRWGLQGPSYGTVSACAAGAHAVGTGLRMIQSGEADAVVCGGAEAALNALAEASFRAMDAISNSGVSRPFDARRDGFVMAEGAGMLVLEDADAAAARGATVLAEIAGYGATSDAHHLTAPHPEGAGAERAIRLALADAGVEAGDVDYVNAHGTSTPLNDRTETLALKRALGERASDVPVSSLKSSIGHLLGAAGAVEAIATVLALRERVAPPTLNWEQADDGMDLDYVPGSARGLDLNGKPPVAISDSFGFGGHNAVICIRGTAA